MSTALSSSTSAQASFSASTPSVIDTKNPWLHAWHDPLAGLKTTSSCVRLGDLSGDGESRLCVCDIDRFLKIYRGTSVMAETALLDNPTALCIIYSELGSPRIPTLAVAAGSHIFMYRQLRPYKKWSCPPMDVSQAEADIWNDIKSDTITVPAAIKALGEIREGGVQLTSRSVDLLALDPDSALAFAFEQKESPCVQNTLITCMDILKKDSDEPDSLCLLVVGTEAGHLFILPQDPVNSAVLCKLILPSAPVLLNISGLFDVEWRIAVTCRDGKLYSIKNGDIRGSAVLSGATNDLGSQPVAISRQDKLLWVATMDRTLSCYTTRGKRTKTILLSEDVVDMTTVVMKRAKIKELLVVALASGEIRLYRDSTLVHSFTVEKPISALRFGPYGREEHCLIVIHGKGCITAKIWRRAADIESANLAAGPPPEQDVPLPVPKKTKLYVEQTQREREQAPQMHRTFQRDLCKLRLETARAYVKTLTDGSMGSSNISSSDIRVHVQVQGLGPLFQLRISLQNAGSQPILQCCLFLTFDQEQYVMGHSTASNQCMQIPVLLPGPKYIVETSVLSIDPQGRAGQLVLMLFNRTVSSSFPTVSATIRMPASELQAL